MVLGRYLIFGYLDPEGKELGNFRLDLNTAPTDHVRPEEVLIYGI